MSPKVAKEPKSYLIVWDLIYPKLIFLDRFWVKFSLLSCLVIETFFGLGANHTNEPALIGTSLQKASFVLVRVSNL